ncbi:MAG TPA: PilZ domain-containing protein, partial [Candidatus Dormibacteraeota bacterium]|nr:PilZ domain-containing protein [Candidatus Dormibacteraeota bacterium]
MATNQTNLATQEPAPERRRNPRVAPTLLTYVSFGGSNGGMVLDVSETGMALATALAMPEAQTINIAIPTNQPQQLIEVRGTTVWISDSKRRVGVRLLDPSPASRDYLRKWVATVLERKLSGAPEPDENSFSYFSPASIVENCAPLPLQSESKPSDDIDPLLDSFIAALRQKPQSRKSLVIMNAVNAAANGRASAGDLAEKFSAPPADSEPDANATPADFVSADADLTPDVLEAPAAHDSPVVYPADDSLPPASPQSFETRAFETPAFEAPASEPQFSESQSSTPPAIEPQALELQPPPPPEFTEQPPPHTEADLHTDEDVRIDFDSETEEASPAASDAISEKTPELANGFAVDVGMIDPHADVEPPARKIAEHEFFRPQRKPREGTAQRAATSKATSKATSLLREPMLLAAAAIIVVSFAIGIGIGRSFWKRHAGVAPNAPSATVAQQTSVSPALTPPVTAKPVTPTPVTPTQKTAAPKTSASSTPMPNQT